MTWKQWTAIGLTAAVIITGVVLHLVQPEVSYAFTEIVGACAFVLGGISGYLLKKNDVIKTTKKQLLTD